MSLQGTDLAPLSARVAVARIGAFRLGFIPEDVEGPGTTGPGEYAWQEIKPEDDGEEWHVVAAWSMCAEKCVASFTIDVPVPLTNQILTFTDTTTPAGEATFWHWDFGDGTTSSDQNPTHQYAHAGTWTIRLWTSSPRGACTASMTIDVIDIPPVVPVVADFTVSTMEGGLLGQRTMRYTDASSAGTPPFTCTWDFGDGSPADVGDFVQHIYSQGGGPNPQDFSVRLDVVDSLAQADSVTKTVTVIFNS